MTAIPIPLPRMSEFLTTTRNSACRIRHSSGIRVDHNSIKRLLFADAFTDTFNRLRTAHGMGLPLSFPSVLAELNVLCILSLLNFASGYRVPLHEATGRGAFDSIRALVFSMYISSDTDGDLLSATGMQNIEEGKVAELMNVANKVHQEKPHKDLPGIMVGELGGPIWEVVQLVTKVLRETGDVLVKGGYPNLGAFVLEALKEGEKARQRAAPADVDPECDVILERLVRAIPAFQDMAIVNGQPVYCFKKALLTIHTIALRFGTMTPPPFPIPRTSNLPIFSDNVIPSMLVHLGVIDLSNASLGLAEIFPNANNPEILDALLSLPPPAEESKGPKTKKVPKEGPILTVEQAFALRAAAIDACELIVETARNLTDEELAAHEKGEESLGWLREITLPEVDAWIWAVAKDRADYRSLPRFVLTNTPYF